MNQPDRCAACQRPAVATLQASNSPTVYGTCTADREQQIAALLSAGANSVQVSLLVQWAGIEAGRWRRVGVRRQ